MREIPTEFFADAPATAHLPLLDAWLAGRDGRRPLAGITAILIQHQLNDQMPMVGALFALGLDPARTWWLDIPYTSHAVVREHVRVACGVPADHLTTSDYRVLQPYVAYQHARAVDMVARVVADRPERLLVLDDGGYMLEALASLAPARRPRHVAVVEQTTRGFIKIARSAALRRIVRELPLVDVARSTPKRTLEPPFIAMSICAALEARVARHVGSRLNGRCLVLGYGAIGEQVATFLRRQFDLPKSAVHVHDSSPDHADLARRRGFPSWSPDDDAVRFRLVVGCSGQASFGVGDHVALEDGALLVSASSGAVEMSRQDFIELADASPSDDVFVRRDAVDERDVHADIPMHLVDRDATFVNGGFPVNFDGRLTVSPPLYIQPTPLMMVAAAVQAVDALDAGRTGTLELDAGFCTWVDREFRAFLGDRASWLVPPPDEAW